MTVGNRESAQHLTQLGIQVIGTADSPRTDGPNALGCLIHIRRRENTA